MSITRRDLFVGTAAVAATAKLASAAAHRVTMPNGALLPFKDAGGAKIFHLKAAPLEHEIAPGLKIQAWGYNGSTPGPII